MKILSIFLSIILLFSGCKKDSNGPDRVSITISASTVPVGELSMIEGVYSDGEGIVNFVTDGGTGGNYQNSFVVPNHSTVTVSAVANLGSKEANVEISINGKTVASNKATPGLNGLVMAQVSYPVSIK